MKSQKLNPKQYQGKDRVFTPISGYQNISKIWSWNKGRQIYEVSAKRPYFTRKYISQFGGRKRVYECFATLEAARSWQISVEAPTSSLATANGDQFRDVVALWKKKRFPNLAPATRVTYERVVAGYYQSLMDVPMGAFDSTIVSEWVDQMLARKGADKRVNFEKEVDMLTTIMNFYQEVKVGFRNPIQAHHRRSLRVGKTARRVAKKKDITESDFFKFRNELAKLKHGDVFYALATVQYYQALRIGEAAAIHWDDLDWNHSIIPRVVICKSVKYIRLAGTRPFIENNYKNSGANGGAKEQPLFEESIRVLNDLGKKSQGLVFHIDGDILTYRQIQAAYDGSFKNAELPFRGSHVLRHGGVRRVLDKTGDYGIAKQILGNNEMSTVMVYARRSTSALTEFAVKERAEGAKPWLQLVTQPPKEGSSGS